MSYPVTLEIDQIERRSRLTTFFRVLLGLPLLFVGIFYGIAAGFAVIAAWFALLFTARWPVGLYEFVGGVLRFTSRTNAYMLLAVDRYPPFGLAPDDAYPARLRVDPPKARYSRLKVFFRGIYIIPAYIVVYIIGLLSYLLWIASWFVIVITGRQPTGLQNAIVFCLSYTVRVTALMYLLTETYPPFGAD